MNLKKKIRPSIMTGLCIILLFFFQHCGSGGGGAPGISKESSPVAATNKFINDSYFLETITDEGLVIWKLDFKNETEFETHTYKYTGNDRAKAIYQNSKGTYKFLENGKIETTTTEDTCDENGIEVFEFDGVPNKYITLKQDGVSVKFISGKTLDSSVIEKTIVLVDDVDCGEKNSAISSVLPPSTPYYKSNPSLNANPQILDQVNKIKSSVTCYNGDRLAKDYSFYVQGTFNGGSRTTIGGQFVPGYMTAGSLSQLYVGVSTFRDLMFVTKVTDGSNILGYNVTLSYCEMKSAYQNLPPIISNETDLTNFSAQNGIILDTDTHCGYGVVEYAQNTYITATRTTSNLYASGPTQIPTSFTKPTCNGQF